MTTHIFYKKLFVSYAPLLYDNLILLLSNLLNRKEISEIAAIY